MTIDGRTPLPKAERRPRKTPEAGNRIATPVPATGLRILVVDDEPAIRNSIRRLLARRGFRVEAVPTGADAIAQLRLNQFDAVITDMRMPGLTGAELHGLVCGEFPDMAHRMIFTSGDLTQIETQAFLKRSGCPSLEKPYGLVELIAVLHDISPAREQTR